MRRLIQALVLIMIFVMSLFAARQLLALELSASSEDGLDDNGNNSMTIRSMIDYTESALNYANDNFQAYDLNNPLAVKESSREYFEKFKLKQKYVASFRLLTVDRHFDENSNEDFILGRATIGFMRPYYHIRDDIRVIGNFDLRLESEAMGITSEFLVTIGYDMQKYIESGRPNLKFGISYCAFKLKFPLIEQPIKRKL